MHVIDYRNTPSLYAKIYSQLNITGTIYLAYRDLPAIIHKNVTGNKALDYGCGAGISTIFLQSLGFEVEGADINASMLNYAKIKNPSSVYHHIIANKIPVENETYDFVLAAWVFMEIPTKAELKFSLSEIARVLKKDGKFFALVCTREAYGREWLTTDTKFPENNNIKSGSKVKMKFKDINLIITDYFWTEEDYTELMLEVGFSITSINKPLGRIEDGYDWKEEKDIAPYAIYVTTKQ